MPLLNLKARYPGAALVTGASSGIGEAYARRLAAEGMDLVVVARRRERLKSLADDLEQDHGVRVHVIAVDLSEKDSAQRVKADVAAEGIEVGMLVNNAGFGSLGLFTKLDPEREAQMVDLNCRATVAMTSCFAADMVRRRKGAIIIVSSLAAYQPTPFFATYGATKAFGLFFGETLWAELRPYGVDVQAMSPGFTASEFQEAAGLKTPSNVNWASPEDVVEWSLERLGKGPSTVHGRKNYVVSCLNRFFPRRMMAWAAYKARMAALKNNRRIQPD